jgi:hypothetical protein
MAAFLGIEPDEAKVRGSRFTQPRAIPVSHAWKIVCREPGLRADEQVTRIIERLAPHTARIAALAERLSTEDEEHGGAVLEIVRYFNDDDADLASRATAVPAWRTSTPGQPDLFGWHLDRSLLEFLHATGAVLDVDEYDMTPTDDPND